MIYIHLIVMFIYTFGTGWKNRGLHVHVLYSFKLNIENLEGKLPSADPHLYPMLFWILGNVKKHVNLCSHGFTFVHSYVHVHICLIQ